MNFITQNEYRLFQICVKYKKLKNKRHRYSCKLGLWGVEGPDRSAIFNEALNYWLQYFADKEYNQLIKKSNQK